MKDHVKFAVTVLLTLVPLLIYLTNHLDNINAKAKAAEKKAEEAFALATLTREEQVRRTNNVATVSDLKKRMRDAEHKIVKFEHTCCAR